MAGMIGFDPPDSGQHGPPQMATRPDRHQCPLGELIRIQHSTWYSQRPILQVRWSRNPRKPAVPRTGRYLTARRLVTGQRPGDAETGWIVRRADDLLLDEEARAHPVRPRAQPHSTDPRQLPRWRAFGVHIRMSTAPVEAPGGSCCPPMLHILWSAEAAIDVIGSA